MLGRSISNSITCWTTSKVVSPVDIFPTPTENEIEYLPMTRPGLWIVYLIVFVSPALILNTSSEELQHKGASIDENIVQLILQFGTFLSEKTVINRLIFQYIC